MTIKTDGRILQYCEKYGVDWLSTLVVNGEGVCERGRPVYHDRGSRNAFKDRIRYWIRPGNGGGTLVTFNNTNGDRLCVKLSEAVSEDSGPYKADSDQTAKFEDALSLYGRMSDKPTMAGYFERKGVLGTSECRFSDRTGMVAIPYRVNEKISLIQFIQADGTKKQRSLPGGLRGCYHVTGRGKGDLMIAEGYATAYSLNWLFPGAFTVSALCAGNLKNVAEHIRSVTSRNIVIAADHDPEGIRAAEQAAAAVGGKVVVPEVEGDDFNDVLLRKRGK